MQLNGEECWNLGMIEDGDRRSVRPASYDLRVGKVIVEGTVRTDATAIKPQQMFIIVSQERVKIPPGYVGYAMPKTSLCNDGILALNTGIVDPGWNGPISTTAINFDQETREVRPGDSFLRIVLHRLEHDGPAEEVRTPVNADIYVEERRRASERYPSTFLDVPGQVEALTRQVADDILGKQNNLVLWLIGILSVLFFLWNLAGYNLLEHQAADGTRDVPASVPNPQLKALEAKVDSILKVVEAQSGDTAAPGSAAVPAVPTPSAPPTASTDTGEGE